MPRKEIKYYCNICGKVHMIENEAIECEKSHLIPIKVKQLDYDMVNIENRYPTSVLVDFDNGNSVKYYRKEY